jgi:hypothetical protein
MDAVGLVIALSTLLAYAGSHRPGAAAAAPLSKRNTRAEKSRASGLHQPFSTICPLWSLRVIGIDCANANSCADCLAQGLGFGWVSNLGCGPQMERARVGLRAQKAA